MLSERTKHISPAATIELSAKIAELKLHGEEIISLNIGEPDFFTPDNISNAAKTAIDEHFTKYQPVPGISALREAICRKLERDNHISYQPNEICVSAGAKQAVFNSIFVLCGEGDEVIIPVPCWVSYSEIVKLSGAVPVYVPCRPQNGFQLDLEQIKAAVTPKTRAILINTPNNPTGAVYQEEMLWALGRLAVEHNFFIISDEIYERIVYDDAVHTSIASLAPEIWSHCITINGFSKEFSMPGWRVGYSAAPTMITKAICAVQGHITSAACSIAQKAALEALTGPQDAIDRMCEEYAARRKKVAQGLSEIPGLSFTMPTGAFYFFVDVSYYLGGKVGTRTLQTSMDIADYLLDRARVAVVPGEAFHLDGYLRISYSNSMEKLNCALLRIKEAFAQIDVAASSY